MRTYGLPVLVTNCSNNYGPYHFPEKLIPLMIINALAGKPLPVYGDGGQIRDWLYVEDHARALYQVVTRGRPGETYVIGGHNERRNIDVVEALCGLLEQAGAPHPPASSRSGSSSRRWKTGRGTTGVMRLTPVRLRANWVGGRRKPSTAGWPRPCSGI
ncbi:hypothetical protein SODG_003398 [Sodalis praecaptivus]